MDSGLLGAVAAGAGPDDYSPAPPALMDLQRVAGNRATAHFVQRIGMDPMPFQDPNLKKDVSLSGLGDDFDKKSDAEKVVVIRDVAGKGMKAAVAYAWGHLGDELGVARANPDLFSQSVKLNDDILDHGAFEQLREKFKKDVEGTALANLNANRELVLAEMERTGVAAEAQGKEVTTDQDASVQDVQKLVPEMERINEVKGKMLGTTVGINYGALNRQTGEPEEKRARFDPANKPGDTLEGAPTWDEVNAQWLRVLMTEAALIRKNPSAAYFMGVSGQGDMGALKDKTDIKAARAAIATALTDLSGKIDKAVPLIGNGIKFTDMPPIQQQLLIGSPAPSGTNWSKPVEKAVAGEEIADATVVNLLKTLGIGTISAAFFIFASIATAGGAAALGAVLFAGGAVASAGQAAMSWDKYRDLSTAQQATVDPELALVTGEQVDEALVSAILDSVFALVDVWQGVKGAAQGAQAWVKGRGLLNAGKAGAAGGARAALQTLGKAGINEGEVIGKALAELGPEEVRKLTGLPYDELAKKVGGEGSEVGKRLLELGSKGLSAETKALLEKLPKLVELEAVEGEKVLRAALDTHGVAGTLDRVGGWAAIKKSPAMKAGTGSAAVLEGWRKQLVTELEAFIATESEGMSKAVRTGTEKASSDLDVQIVQGTAAELQQKAESWLSGRVGKDIEGAKKLLDAEIFVDPFRSHFYDVVKGLDDVARKQIAEKMGDYERKMVAGAEIRKAGGAGTEAGDKAIKDWADKGVGEPFLDFEPLAPTEQKKVAGMVDGWMEELKNAKTAEEKGPLVEKISKAQAQINASHADAYVGGGVHAWVTGREDALEDVKKLAEAVNMSPEELLKVSNAQRIMASLNEAKWLETAAGRLRKPTLGAADDVGKVAKDVTDIGKHGGRAASQLSRAGAPNAAALDALFEQLTKFKNMPSDEVALALKEGRMAAIEGDITGLLESLKKSTKTAVEGLGAELKTFASTGADMAEFQRLLLWQTRYAAMVDDAVQTTTQFIKLYKDWLEAEFLMSLPEGSPTSSQAPAGGQAGAPPPAGAGAND